MAGQDRRLLSPEESDDAAPQQVTSKIRTFEQRLGGAAHQQRWKRATNVTGVGATHMKSFHCKLSTESLEYLDQQINEWLDEHTDYEVKFVTTAVGEWTGKTKEPQMVVQLWV